MVALLRTGRRPWVEYAGRVEDRGSAAAVLEEELAAAAAPTGQTTLFPDRPDSTRTADGTTAERAVLLDEAVADLDRWSTAGMRLVTVLEPELSPESPRCPRPPADGVRRGAPDAGGRPRGRRRRGAQGDPRRQRARPRAIAEHLVDRGFTVVSGLAAGIDTAAHTGALARGGRTVAVIGTGLGRSYPPQNEALQRRIASECAVVSQFWPDAPPSRRSFPMRNAVMSGITLATVVVEASDTSGARMQARLARAQGRPVFLLASLVERQQWAREYAARPGTHVVRSPDEITTVVERLISPGSLVA